MENRILQLERYSRDELLKDFETVINKIVNPPAVKTEMPAKIIILNRKEAARALGISLTFFDKLRARGIVPCTVDAGINNNGKPREMWALHHLMSIRGIVVKLKYAYNDDMLIEAKHHIKKILGL